MAALVNALSYRLAVADRRSLHRDPVATSNPRASNLVVRAGWFDNNKDVDGRDPMYEQQQEILRRRRKGGNLESEVNKRRAKVSGFMKGTLAKEEMNAIKGDDGDLGGDQASKAVRTADIESICTRCAVDPAGRPTNGRSGTVRAACFLDSHGRRFVHVDGAGCDQATVARYFGTGCEKRGEPARVGVRTTSHGAGGGTH